MSTKTFLDKLAANLIASLPLSKNKPTGIKAPGLLQPQVNQFDERTTAQLQNSKFSGIRSNDLWSRFEFWILGYMEMSISYQEVFLNPDIINRKYCELFGLDALEFDERTQQDIQRIRDLKKQVQDFESGK